MKSGIPTEHPSASQSTLYMLIKDVAVTFFHSIKTDEYTLTEQEVNFSAQQDG